MRTEIIHRFSPHIFNEYDIRGKYPEELNEVDAYYLGLSLGIYLRSKNIKGKVCVASDSRESSGIIKKFFINALLSIEIDVLNLGTIPTPALYYATHTLDNAASVMITASHNPLEYNGFKIAVQKEPLFGKDLKKLSLISNSKLSLYKSPNQGNIYYAKDLLKEYINNISKLRQNNFVKSWQNRSKRLVWLCDSDVVKKTLQELTIKLPGKHNIIHIKNVSLPFKNNKKINSLLESSEMKYFFQLDYDGDRLYAYGSNLTKIEPEILLILFTKELIKKHESFKIVVDPLFSERAIRYITTLTDNKVEFITSYVGHSYVKQKISSENALIGAEISGHYYFKEDYYGFDDGIFAALKLINLITNTPSQSIFLENLPEFHIKEINLKCEKRSKRIKMKKITNSLKSKNHNIQCGVIKYWEKEGCAAVHCSNTEDVIRLRIESDSKENLLFMLDHVFSIIAESKIFKNQDLLCQSFYTK